MNRNSESLFSFNPTNLDISRSKFVRPSQHKTTFNAGDLIPIYIDEILPGDTATMDMATIVRMSTPIFPVMDNAYLDFYFFFVPNRLVWDHWKEFNGENNSTYWEQPVEYEIPQIEAPENGWAKGTIADYMGIPTEVDGISVSALPFRIYATVWNEWFRDENLKQPTNVNKDDTTVTGSNGTNEVTDPQLGGMPLKVAKYRDYFTSALPQPQKGPDVLLPIGGVQSEIPVIGNGKALGLKLDENIYDGLYYKANSGAIGNVLGSTGAAYNKDVGAVTDSGSIPSTYDTAYYTGITDEIGKSGMIAVTNATGASTINMLRQAFAIQRLYEKDARGGSRYTEVLRAHFGVVSPDARLQRPEYLGGSRVPINMDQVIQTSETGTSPQGNTAAYSMTSHTEHSFTKSFTEHGFIIGLACIRTDHTYQQGIERFWSRKKRFDFYWPSLANIGEQAILNKEIYAQGTSADDEAFGYQEAWAEYRYKPSRVSGAFRSNYAQTLDAWHYADYYTAQPYLSSAWINETAANIDRTIAVSEEVEDQFIADFFFKNTMVRPMPLYSIPGLIDHH